MAAFTDHLATHYVPNTVIVDATASEVRLFRLSSLTVHRIAKGTRS